MLKNIEKDERNSTTQLVSDAEELYEKSGIVARGRAEKLEMGQNPALCAVQEHPLVVEYTESEISDSRKRPTNANCTENLESLKGETDKGIRQRSAKLASIMFPFNKTKQKALENVIGNFARKNSGYQIGKTVMAAALGKYRNRTNKTDKSYQNPRKVSEKQRWHINTDKNLERTSPGLK